MFRMDETLKLLILCAWACSFSALRCAASADPPVAINEDPIKFTAPNQNPIRFTTEGATEESYQQFIEALRERLQHERIHNFPVLINPQIVEQSNRYVTVELSNSETESIQIGIDVTNAYVVAYQAGTQVYFFRDIPQSAYTNLFPDIPRDHRDNLTFTGDYGALESVAGRSREQTDLGLNPLINAISSLHSERVDNRAIARSMIVIIQMVAEAARFHYITNRVRVNIRTGQNFQPGPTMLSFENSWKSLSTGVQRSVQETFPNEVTITSNSYQPIIIGSLSNPALAAGLALMLFICHPNANQSPLVIKSIVEKSETCNPSEPTVHIAGRDGMCVDVSNSAYNDGNPIIMWKCADQENQMWTLKQDKTIRSKGKCLTTYGYAPGNYIMIYACDSAVAEATYWDISEDGTIINPNSGLVLSAESSTMGGTLTVQKDEYRMRQGWRAGNDTSPFVTSIAGYLDLCMEAHGSNMWLADCDRNKKEQQWALYPDGSIRPVQNTNSCLTSEEHKQGATIVMMACSNAWASQRWVFKDDGTIYSLYDHMVMDVRGSDPNLKQIILWPSTGNPNQQWGTLF